MNISPTEAVNILGIVSVLILNIFQSIKSGHFKSKCGSVEIENEYTLRDSILKNDKDLEKNK